MSLMESAPPARVCSRVAWCPQDETVWGWNIDLLLGELAMDVLGDDGQVLPGDALHPLQRLFLWTRCDTIYAGSNQIQRNIIGERALGLPRGPR